MAGRGTRTSAPEADPASTERASDPDATGATAAAPNDRASGPPPDLRRSAWWWIRAAAVLTTIFLTVQLLGVVQSFLAAILTVVLYVLFGAVIAFIAGPIVQQLERRLRLPQVPAILLTLLCGLALVVLLGFLITAPIVDEASQLSKQGPALIKQINDIFNSVRDQLAAHGIQLSGNGISNSISTDVSTRVAAALLNAVYSTLNILIDILVTLVVAFWMLKDGEELRSGVVNLLPGRFRSEAIFGLDAFGVVVGGYVRGQLVMALIVGTLAGLGCWLIGVPFPIVVAIAAGTFELIPLVGAFIGGAVAILLALTKSPEIAVFAFLLFVAIHIVEGYILAPRIQAAFVRLHPLVMLLALFAGAETAGFLGAFVAVPTASLVAVFVRAAMGDAKSHHPELFREQRRDKTVERRRRRILSEFRLFRRTPPDTGAKTDIDTVA
jgi:predicted PurR-regulated permease PerM